MSRLVSYSDVMKLIPERPPLLMIDRLELDTESQRARAIKAVSMDEHFFQGHFPETPIMPGVLQVAAMLQLAGVLIRILEGEREGLMTRVKTMTRVKFRKPVLPGDLMMVEAEIKERTPTGTFLVRAETQVAGATACEGTLEIELVTPEAACPAPDQLVPPMRPLPDLGPDAETFDVLGVMATIPHRFPFLLVDRVLTMDRARTRVSAIKNVTGNEPLFAGVPIPVFPECTQVEAAAQAACAVALKMPGNQGKIGFFMSIDEAKFMHPVVPGDQLLFELNCIDRGRFGLVDGALYVGERMVTQLALKFAIVPRAPAAP